MCTINLVNFKEGANFYVKTAKRFSKVKSENIKLRLHLDEGVMAARYMVNGIEYNNLFVKADNGKSMVDAADSYLEEFGIWSKLLCKRTGETVLCNFVYLDGKFCFDTFLSDGNIEESKFVLNDGDYDAVIDGSGHVCIETGATMEENGYKYENNAVFANDFDEDGNKVVSTAEKVCPSEDKRKIGLEAIRTLFETLEKNGLSLVAHADASILGVVNKRDYKYVDSGDNDAVPAYFAIPFEHDKQFLYVSEATSIALKD